MMKRFTETLKWRDPWFRGLSIDGKLVFLYLVDNCDAAGVWDPDLQLVNFCVKRDVEWDAVRSELGDRIKVLPTGKWWLTRFIAFQYGPTLNLKNPVHQGVLRRLETAGVECSPFVGTPKVLPSPMPRSPEGPLKGPKEEAKAKEKDKEEGGPGETNGAIIRESGRPLPPLLDNPRFREAWGRWQKHWPEAARRVSMPLETSDEHLRILTAAGMPDAVEWINNAIAVGRLTKPCAPFKPRENDAGHESASLGALQMQLKAIEDELERILYPGGGAYKTVPTGENLTRVLELKRQREAIKTRMEAFA